MDWHLPDGYLASLAPAYHDDVPSDSADLVHLPEAYEVVRYLLQASGRGTVIDIGCGTGRKLRDLPAGRRIGVDYGANVEFCRNNYPDAGEWLEANLLDQSARLLARHASSDSIVICADVIEHLPDPTQLLELLNDCYRRGAIVITTTPDRVRVRGADHSGPPPNEARVREWELSEYRKVIADAGLSLTFAGYTVNNTRDRALKTIITISDPDVSSHSLRRNRDRPLAIIAAYNEVDILDEVIADWLNQGCDVYLIDDWSTDGTWESARRWAISHPARVTVERCPDAPRSTYEWVPLLHRKADIAARFPGRWIIHSDADEIRRSPLPDFNLADSLDLVAHCGANRVDFRVINFRPAQDEEPLAREVQRSLRSFRFGSRPGHLRQAKAWLQGASRVDLASSGGHEAQFEGVKDFRYKFLLKHYPLRSAAHARRKIEDERKGRRSTFEYEVLGFHVQYDDVETSKFGVDPDAIEWREETFWPEYGLLIMTDLLQSRLERGWMNPEQ